MVEIGDTLSTRTGRVADIAFCIWDCPVDETANPQEHIDWAVAFLEGADEELRAVGLEIDIRLSLSPHAWQTCFAVDGRSMRTLGALDAQLNIDVYSSGEEDEELTISDAV